MGEKYIKRPIPTGTESVGLNGRANWDVIQYRFDTFSKQRTGSRLARRIAGTEDIRFLSKIERALIGKKVSELFQKYHFLNIALALNNLDSVEADGVNPIQNINSYLEEKLK